MVRKQLKCRVSGIRKAPSLVLQENIASLECSSARLSFEILKDALFRASWSHGGSAFPGSLLYDLRDFLFLFELELELVFVFLDRFLVNRMLHRVVSVLYNLFLSQN